MHQYRDELSNEALHFSAEHPINAALKQLEMSHFGATEIGEFTAENIKRLLLSDPTFSKCPRNILQGIIDNISEDTDFWRCSPEIEYTNRARNRSVIVGYKYDFLMQRVSRTKYAFVFVMVGAEFMANYIHIADSNPESRSSCRGEPRTSLRSNGQRNQQEVDTVNAFVDQLIAYNFQQQIKHVTLPRLHAMNLLLS